MLATLALDWKEAISPLVSRDGRFHVQYVQDSPELELVGGMTRRLAGLKTPANQVMFAPDGRTVAASAVDGEVCLWATASGRLVFRAEDADRGRAGAFWGPLAFSPDGRTLAVGDLMSKPRRPGVVEPQVVGLWDARSGRQKIEIRTATTGDADAVRFAPDGRSLWIGGWALTQVDARSGRTIREPLRIVHARLSEDGRRAYAPDSGWFTVWDLEARRMLVRARDDAKPSLSAVDARFSPDDRSVAVIRSRQDSEGDIVWTKYDVDVWRCLEGTRGLSVQGLIDRRLAFSPDSGRVVFADGVVREVGRG